MQEVKIINFVGGGHPAADYLDDTQKAEAELNATWLPAGWRLHSMQSTEGGLLVALVRDKSV